MIIRKIFVLVILISITSFYLIKKSAQRIFFEAPIVLDLNNNGIELIALKNSKAFFDIDNDSMRENIGWVKASDGILVIDKNNNGKIDDATELFGKSDKNKSDAQELLQYDQDNNGKIDKSDPIFDQLKVWQDNDENGDSTPNELTTLKQNGIVAINFRDSKIVNKIIAGNVIKQEGFFTISKTRKAANLASVQLAVNQVQSIYKNDYDLKLEAIMLPLSRGYGDVKPLHIAASEDDILLQMGLELVHLDPSKYKDIDSKVELIIYRWAGVENVSGMRGLFDAKKLAAMEKFRGKKYLDKAGNSDVMTEIQAKYVNDAWQSLTDLVKIKFLVQRTFRNIFAGAAYSFSTDSHQYYDLTYAVILARISDYYYAIDKLYRKDFINQIGSLLKKISLDGKITDLDQDKIDNDLALIINNVSLSFIKID
jgi:hypothetical protein